ncbi:hypothetical protein ID866_10856 [Astraeus odoratus]|nr:hypothetical protein ID866_10856 [Astraeus odoratus]
MSSFCRTSSLHKHCLAKTKAPKECTEEEWRLVSKGELNPMSSDDEKTAEIEEGRGGAQEEAVKREREEREAAAWMAWEAVEVQADAEQRALEERLWDAAVQHLETVVAPLRVAKPGRRMASGVQDPCTQCHNKGILCILGAAKGKTTACEACCHAKVSCSWTKRMAREARKRKQVCCSEEVDNVEMVEASKDNKEEETQLHFAVPPHLVEEHRDTPRALTATLDMLSTEFYEFWRDYWGFGGEVLRVMDTIALELKRANDLKEEEMGKTKGKGKEKEEGPRRGRTEDEDRDTEMGRAGPSSLA